MSYKLSPATSRLLDRHIKAQKKEINQSEEPVISVDEIAIRVASFYEKIRGIIDWKGENLLRRSAIERTLRRMILPKISLGENKQGENLVTELIRSGHFPNDTIPEKKIEEIEKVLDKYFFLLRNAPKKEEGSLNGYQWITSIAACEIEEVLSGTVKERELIEYMHSQMKDRIKIEGENFNEIPKEKRNLPLHIAIQKALFDLDEPIITYHLLKYIHPNWNTLKEEELEEISENLFKIKRKIEDYFTHPLTVKFLNLSKKYNTPYLLIGDILKENPKNIKEHFSDPQRLETLIKKSYKERERTLKSRLSRAAVYATLSIFITNVAALYLLEIPLAGLMDRPFPFEAMTVTILVPTLLMALLVISINPPPEKNLSKVLIETIKIVYKREKEDLYRVKESQKRGMISNLFINLVYFGSFAITLIFIIWGLTIANFPPLSYLIFIIFLSLISFAGMKIREGAKELHMIEEEETFFNAIFDIFAIPVIRTGKWLTLRWKKYNLISIFFSALIDMPFMTFVKFIEQWRRFLKEKKEDIY